MPLRTDQNLNDKLSKLERPVKDADGNWPDYDKWPQLRAVVVCATTGCPVEGIGFEVTLYVQIEGSLHCVCGRCGGQVVDMRGDLTAVGQDKRAELKENPRLLKERQEAFNKRKKGEEKDPSLKNL